MLKGIYAALVKFDGDKGTVRVKSHINSDVISLCDKAGNPIAGVSASKVNEPGTQYHEYYEFNDVPLDKLKQAYYLRFYNAGDNGDPSNPNYYDGVYKLFIIIYSDDNKIRKLKFDSEKSGVDYMTNGEAHRKFLDPSIASIGNAVLIPNTNLAYGIIDDTDYVDKDIKTYVYLEGHPASRVSVNNKKVNSDHAPANVHDEYFDVQEITIPKGKGFVDIPLKVTAYNNEAKEYALTLYRKSTAIEISEINLRVKESEAKPELKNQVYPAIKLNDFEYAVVVPEGIDTADITTVPLLADKAKVAYGATAPNADKSYDEVQAGVYEGFKLSGDTKEDVATIRLKIAETESPAYRLRIIKLNQSDEPMVKADDNLLTKLNTDDVDIEGVYKYTIPAGAAKVKVNITTSVHGADVKIGDLLL